MLFQNPPDSLIHSPSGALCQSVLSFFIGHILNLTQQAITLLQGSFWTCSAASLTGTSSIPFLYSLSLKLWPPSKLQSPHDVINPRVCCLIRVCWHRSVTILEQKLTNRFCFRMPESGCCYSSVFSNHRTISVLPFVSKVLEKVV